MLARQLTPHCHSLNTDWTLSLQLIFHKRTFSLKSVEKSSILEIALRERVGCSEVRLEGLQTNEGKRDDFNDTKTYGKQREHNGH